MYREMFKKMCIYAKCRLGDDELAEEAVQETFRVACEKQVQVIASENPRGWIMETLKLTIMSIQRERIYLNKLYKLMQREMADDGASDENVDVMYSDIVNEEDFEITIPKHTKLAQGVLRKVYNCTFVEVEEVNDTVRGEGGFGSTGTTINEK